ncbi:phosphotransferase [Actinoalloteichus sp. AHMU CJ021]|uniref:AAA family ATPase n=1 Tax=Actinoalloteichus TaxID=65496 RepID=UPI0004AAC636|nr:AAA family ATPase [Actinoalloteichus caeruleus]AUS77536.1 phosphotransferase [Actinoalloteichus sp. AHMU CJ021]
MLLPVTEPPNTSTSDTPPPLTGVLVLTGVMAAGKTTVARTLADRLPRSAHVGGDAFLRMVRGGREDMTPHPTQEARRQLRLRHRLTAHTADLLAEEGFTVVVEDILIGPDLTRFLATLRTRPLRLVVLAPTPRAIADRERERTKDGYLTWDVATLDGLLRADTPRQGLWLDTSDQTPAATVEDILAHADEALVTPDRRDD